MNTAAEKQPSCEDRIESQWESRRADLAAGLKILEYGGVEEWDRLDTRERIDLLADLGLSIFAARGDYPPDDIPNLYDYGLAFDYVAPETFNDQLEGYWRYQLSWGGPADEIRFYASHPDAPLYRAEYWFLDWHDGASLDITRDEIAATLWEWFEPSSGHVYEQATEE